jgi:hypothetical protein
LLNKRKELDFRNGELTKVQEKLKAAKEAKNLLILNRITALRDQNQKAAEEVCCRNSPAHFELVKGFTSTFQNNCPGKGNDRSQR